MEKDNKPGKPTEIEGYDSKGIKRKMLIFPKDATPEDIYWMVIEHVWNSREEKALRENKSLEQVVREQGINAAKQENKTIDIDKHVKECIEQYKLLLEHRKSVS